MSGIRETTEDTEDTEDTESTEKRGRTCDDWNRGPASVAPHHFFFTFLCVLCVLCGNQQAEPARESCPMPHRITRPAYADIYGPTTGDRVRLGDTSLVLQVERDHATYGDECKFGGGKVLREGMGQAAGVGAKDAL